jgi:hypothetical protein
VEAYKDNTALGLNTRFSDPISMNALDFALSYSPDSYLPADERVHANILYQRMGFHADLRYNYADFYDLFGPTKTSLKGHSIELGYDRPLIYDKPRRMDLSTEIAYYGGLDRVPFFQDIDSSFDELATAQAALHYDNVNRSLGAVDGEKGFKWDAVIGGNRVNGNTIPYAYAGFDAGFALPIANSSVWLRNVAGKANGEFADPFANFYFGGFGNNWVDRREVKRYREPFSMPGFAINEIGGRAFGKTVLEVNLPPILFKRAGSPGFFGTWARPAMFASALVTNPGEARQTFRNVGFQVDFQLYVLSRLEMTLSLGAARGYSDDLRGEDEFMVSLKIL